MLNQCNFIGNLAADVETKTTQTGKMVANFTLAVNTGWGDNVHVEWVRVVCWEKTAEACSNYLEKGKRAFVSGEMQTREWKDNEGNKRYSTEIIARNVQFLSPRSEGGHGQGGNYQGGQNNHGQQQAGPSGGGQYGSAPQSNPGAGNDVPF